MNDQHAHDYQTGTERQREQVKQISTWKSIFLWKNFEHHEHDCMYVSGSYKYRNSDKKAVYFTMTTPTEHYGNYSIFTIMILRHANWYNCGGSPHDATCHPSIKVFVVCLSVCLSVYLSVHPSIMGVHRKSLDPEPKAAATLGHWRGYGEDAVGHASQDTDDGQDHKRIQGAGQEQNTSGHLPVRMF